MRELTSREIKALINNEIENLKESISVAPCHWNMPHIKNQCYSILNYIQEYENVNP